MPALISQCEKCQRKLHTICPFHFQLINNKQFKIENDPPTNGPNMVKIHIFVKICKNIQI